MKTMTAVAGHPVQIRDVKRNLVTASNPPNNATFKANFSVETVKGKNWKVMPGFHMATKAPMSTMRMIAYLQKQQLYLRMQTSRFENNLHIVFTSYLVEENANTADIA